MKTVINKKTGEKIKLLNPFERSRKYCKELHTKKDAFKGNDLTVTQLSFRSGYLKARKEQSKIFKKKNPNYKRKTGVKFK